LVHGIFDCSTHSVLASWMSVGSRTLSGFSPSGSGASDPLADADADEEADADPDALDDVTGDGDRLVFERLGLGVGVAFGFENGNVDATAAMTR
jgi:hypothetical protein